MNVPKVFVRNHGVINLGRQGENDVLQIIWKGIVPAWAEKYGEGKFQLAVRRHLDDAPYIAAIEIDGNDIVWTVTSAETAQTGDGECELTYMVGDAVAKSQTWTTSVCRSLTGEEPTEAPEPYQSWVDEVMKTANDLKLQGIPGGGEKGQALIKKSDESFDAEWAKIEALPEGGAEGQVLTKKSDANGDAEWQNAVQSDWCEIDESSPSYIKNKLGGYYEADLDTLLGYGLHQQTDGSWEYVLFPDFKKVKALDILYIQATFLKSEEAIATFATFNELTDKNNGIGFYLGNLHRGPLGIEYSIYGASLTHINIYSAGIIPMRSEFIPLAKDNAIGGVKLHQTVDNVDNNFWDDVAIGQDGYLFSKKSIQVIESLTSDNVKSLFASAGEAFIVGGSPYLEEKIGLISSDFPVFVTTTEVNYSSGYPRFVYLFFTKTNKSGEFILTTGGDVSSYSIAISESNLFLVHLILGKPDSDGNPTYTVDKTFAEIKTACDAGKKVELIPPADDQNFIMSVGSAPFEVVNVTTKRIGFQSISASPAGVFELPPWTLGGVPLGIISVNISPNEKVSVEFPFSVDGDTGMPVWNVIQKLPQQYVVTVTAGTDGTLSASSTLDQLQSVMQAYGLGLNIVGGASINAAYDGKLYYMFATTRTSVTFAATTENGLETLTVSNDGKEGSADVWTHEVVSLISDYTFCPYLFLHENNTGGYYLSDKDGNEVLPRVISNQYGSIQYIYYRRFKYTISSTGNEAPYVDFLAVNGDKYAIISVDIAANYGQGTVTWSGWEPICPNQTPKVTTADNGKFLRVVDGAWAAAEITNAKGVSF